MGPTFGNEPLKRRLLMHYDTWELHPRWCWETAGRLCLCPIDAYARSLRDAVLKALQVTLADFVLPLEVDVPAPSTQREILNLVTDCTSGDVLHCWDFLAKLNQARHQDPELQPGLVVAFDGRYRSLYDGDRKPDEPPEWGWTSEDGLILLRLVAGQPLPNVVRHEMGHLLGIGEHHPGCVMEWACKSEHFCPRCVKAIRQTCRLVDS